MNSGEYTHFLRRSAHSLEVARPLLPEYVFINTMCRTSVGAVLYTSGTYTTR